VQHSAITWSSSRSGLESGDVVQALLEAGTWLDQLRVTRSTSYCGDEPSIARGHSRLTLRPRRLYYTRKKRSFEPRQRKERKKRNETTSLLDRPITAASDDGVCRWYAATWQTRAKLLKLNLICILSCTTSKKRTKIRTFDFFLIFKS